MFNDELNLEEPLISMPTASFLTLTFTVCGVGMRPFDNSSILLQAQGRLSSG